MIKLNVAASQKPPKPLFDEPSGKACRFLLRRKPLAAGIRLSVASLLVPAASYGSMFVTYKSLNGIAYLPPMPLTLLAGILAFAVSVRYFWRAFPRS